MLGEPAPHAASQGVSRCGRRPPPGPRPAPRPTKLVVSRWMCVLRGPENAPAGHMQRCQRHSPRSPPPQICCGRRRVFHFVCSSAHAQTCFTPLRQQLGVAAAAAVPPPSGCGTLTGPKCRLRDSDQRHNRPGPAGPAHRPARRTSRRAPRPVSHRLCRRLFGGAQVRLVPVLRRTERAAAGAYGLCAAAPPPAAAGGPRTSHAPPTPCATPFPTASPPLQPCTDGAGGLGQQQCRLLASNGSLWPAVAAHGVDVQSGAARPPSARSAAQAARAPGP